MGKGTGPVPEARAGGGSLNVNKQSACQLGEEGSPA